MSDTNPRSGEVWNFELARQIVADEKPNSVERIEEIAAQFSLSESWTEILKAVGIEWPANNMPAFRERLERITANPKVSMAAKAMACEMLASSYSRGRDGADPDKYREMSALALMLSDQPSVAGEDHDAIEASTLLGLVEQGLENLPEERVHGLVSWMINNGAFNGPNRVRVHFGNDRALFERLIAHSDSGERHAYNLFYLGKAREKLAELSAT